MKDDAVSVVIGYMVLLVITVSFIALLNAIWIPQMKQQAEVEHLNQVQDSFLSLATDIDKLTTYRENSSITHRVQLGGGDVLFSPVKSFGTMQLCKTFEEELITNRSIIPVRMFSNTYYPMNNFWINQGFSWDDGVVNVTKPGRISTPVEELAPDLTYKKLSNYYLYPKLESAITSGDKSIVTISVVSFSSSKHDSISGNGFASINLIESCPVEPIDTIGNLTPSAGNWIHDLNQEIYRRVGNYEGNVSFDGKNITFKPNVSVYLKNCVIMIDLQ